MCRRGRKGSYLWALVPTWRLKQQGKPPSSGPGCLSLYASVPIHSRALKDPNS